MKIGKNKGAMVVWENSSIKRFPSLKNIDPIIQDRNYLSQLDYLELQNAPSLELPIVSSKIICLAKNYADHAKEMGVEPKNLPSTPSLFLKPPSSLIGPGDNIIFPPEAQQVDHEVELAIIIGKKGKNIPLDRTFEYIFGYTILLDMTARDIQSVAKKKGRPWFQAKGYDSFCPVGPVIVTSDEIHNPQNLELELRLNGQVKQKGNTQDMIFKIDQIISYCSKIVTLNLGDIIATGTPSGVGPVNKGDKIEATVESIGLLEVGVI
ncbi:MAG: fumarylacetoacetate hydrolase family protein [Candidatus Hodarchaeales archaeon]|jgi:2-keto-4-pentenoate hydratase/2-oxohepta-3-ene-1,7-dioic acid hydratase in catechol pathway